MIVVAFALLQLIKVVAGSAGQCSSWSYSDVFFIKANSLAKSAVVDRVESRSFVECCVKCHAAQGCQGVAFRDGECNCMDGTAAKSFIKSDGSGDDYKVMMYTTADGKEENNCIGNCKKCPTDRSSDDTALGFRPPFEESICTDCKQLLANGHTTDGEHTLADGTLAYCDMTGGGWTVIQRRVNDTVNFKRGWADYVAGFGNISGSFWAGLDKIYALTSGPATELYVYMDTFEDESAWARYSSFRVDDAASGYRMTVSGYTGTAGDAMYYHNNMKFSTFDNDQDTINENCAQDRHGGWWYYKCAQTNPNGLYLGGDSSIRQGVLWYPYKGPEYSLKTIEFKLRRM